MPDFHSSASTLQKLNAVVGHARQHAACYRSRLPEGPLSHPSELETIPLLTGEELRVFSTENPSPMLTAPLRSCYVYSSSGSTGQPKYVFRSHAENAVNIAATTKGLRSAGLTPDDVVMVTLVGGNLWAGLQVFCAATERLGCTVLPVGDMASNAEMMRYIRLFGVTAVLGMPTHVTGLAQAVLQEGDPLRVRKIGTGGEVFFDSARKLVKHALGAEHFLSLGWAANEVGTLGYGCPQLPGNRFHIHQSLQHVETIDERGKACPPGQFGRVVITNLYRFLMPMIRYSLGDMGRFLPDPCPCGSNDPLFELGGRSDDRLRLGGLIATPVQLSIYLAKIHGLSPHFQLIAEKLPDGLDRLTLRVEADRADADFETIRNETEKLLMSEMPDLEPETTAGHIHPTLIDILPPNTIPRNPKTGKLKRCIDRRA